MNTQSPAQQAQLAAQHNMLARQAVLATATPMRKNLGTFGPFAPGQQPNIKLRNVGLITSLDLVVTAQINVTAAATPSLIGPFNFLRNILVSDFNNVNRVNITLRALNTILSARERRVSGRSFGSNIIDTPATLGSAAGLIQLPTALVGAGVTNLRLPVHIPIAYDSNSDLRGAILAQTIRGEMYVSTLIATAAQIFGANDDAVYSAGAGVVANIFITVYQNYLQPQTLGGQLLLPTQDLVTVYELNGGIVSASNLNVGQQKFIDYPNVRQVLSSVHGYFNGGAAGAGFTYGTDVSATALIVNANTDMREYSGPDLFDKMRMVFGGDGLPGFHYVDTRRTPIDTRLFGQVQYAITPSIVNVGAYVESSFESFYLLGTELPGIATG